MTDRTEQDRGRTDFRRVSRSAPTKINGASGANDNREGAQDSKTRSLPQASLLLPTLSLPASPAWLGRGISIGGRAAAVEAWPVGAGGIGIVAMRLMPLIAERAGLEKPRRIDTSGRGDCHHRRDQ